MKAAQVKAFGAAEVLEMIEIPDPVPGPGQVLIEVEGASVNHADILARCGRYHLGKKPPFIPGIDLAGRVIGVGHGVSGFLPGDRVAAFSQSGSYAQKSIADQQLTFGIPENLTVETAAAFPLAGGGAMHLLTHAARLKPGERILVHGASGGIGSMVIQIAKTQGASQVIATTTNPGKKDFLHLLGADTVLELPAEYSLATIMAVSQGRMLDIIVSPFGGSTLALDMACLAPFGRVILSGHLHGNPPPIGVEGLHPGNQALIGFSFGHYRRDQPHTVHRSIDRVIRLLLANSVKVHTTTCLPLSEAAEAHRLLEGRKNTGKIVLLP